MVGAEGMCRRFLMTRVEVVWGRDHPDTALAVGCLGLGVGDGPVRPYLRVGVLVHRQRPGTMR